MGFIAKYVQKGWDALFGEGEIDKAEPYRTAKANSLISTDPKEPDSRTDWWDIYPERWHQVFPYQFIIMQEDLNNSAKDKLKEWNSSVNVGKVLAMYTLPIPPQALSIRMIPASQVTPTVGGVVEETSANVFWDITLQGTTGIAIGKSGSLSQQLGGEVTGGDSVWTAVKSFLFGSAPRTASKFRDVIKTTGEMSGIVGALRNSVSKTLGTLDQIDRTLDSNASAASVVGSLSGGLQNTLLPSPMFTASAVNRTRNGFGEIQQLHRFLLVYSRLKGAFPNKFHLKFRMYKTNQQWKASLKDFQITQNAQNPHLYKYTIKLRCWQIGNAGDEEAGNKQAYDRFGTGGDLAPVNILSLKQADVGLKKIFKTYK